MIYIIYTSIINLSFQFFADVMVNILKTNKCDLNQQQTGLMLITVKHR